MINRNSNYRYKHKHSREQWASVPFSVTRHQLLLRQSFYSRNHERLKLTVTWVTQWNIEIEREKLQTLHALSRKMKPGRHQKWNVNIRETLEAGYKVKYTQLSKETPQEAALLCPLCSQLRNCSCFCHEAARPGSRLPASTEPSLRWRRPATARPRGSATWRCTAPASTTPPTWSASSTWAGRSTSRPCSGPGSRRTRSVGQYISLCKYVLSLNHSPLANCLWNNRT